MKKKSILIIADYFYPHWTGIAKSVFNLTQLLNNEYFIHVLTVQHDKSLKRVENIHGITIQRSPYLFSLSRAKYSVAILIDFLKLVKKFDVIFINSPYTNILPIVLISRIFRKKILVFHHGNLILPAGISNRIIEKIYEVMTIISLLFANKVSTYSSDFATHSSVIRPFMKKFYALRMPVVISDTSKSVLILKKTEELKKDKKILFGYAGRFVEEKGFDILLQAIPYILQSIPNAHFVFAGETMKYENFMDTKHKLLEKTKDSVTFLGLLNQTEIATFYSQIELIIIPSRNDSFNFVQAEAMLCKKPSIVADIPGARFLVEKTNFGYKFKPGDPVDLAKKVVEAYKHKADLAKNSSNISKILDLNKLKKDYVEFIEN